MDRADTNRVSLHECIRLLVLLFASAPRAPTQEEIVEILRALRQSNAFRHGGVERLGEVLDCIYRKKMKREADSTSIEGKIEDFLDHEIRLVNAELVARAVNHVFCFSSDQECTVGASVRQEVLKLMSSSLQESAESPADKAGEETVTVNDAGGPPPSAPPARTEEGVMSEENTKPDPESTEFYDPNNILSDHEAMKWVYEAFRQLGIVVPKNYAMVLALSESTRLIAQMEGHTIARAAVENAISNEKAINLRLIEELRGLEQERIERTERVLELTRIRDDLGDKVTSLSGEIDGLMEAMEKHQRRVTEARHAYEKAVADDRAKKAEMHAELEQLQRQTEDLDQKLRSAVIEQIEAATALRERLDRSSILSPKR